MTNNHTDSIDRQLEQAHRVFTDDHDALREDLLDRLGDVPGDLPSGMIANARSKKRKWMMRSSIGLAATVVIAVALSVALFSSSPISPSLAWSDVRENVEKATAVRIRQSIIGLDAEGRFLKEVGQSSEVWQSQDGRSRMITFNGKGEPDSENIQTKQGTLMLFHPHQHAMYSTDVQYGVDQTGPGDQVEKAESTEADKMTEMLLRVTEEVATRVGETRIEQRPVTQFTIPMKDMIAFYMKEEGLDDTQEMKVEAIFGGSAEALSKLPPMSVWVDTEARLPVRVQMAIAGEMAQMMWPEMPEGGRIALQMDFLAWNEEVDEASFKMDVPEGWALDRSDRTLLGAQTDVTPDDLEVVTAGLPLAEGVVFVLEDEDGQVVLTQADVLSVTEITRRTGYLKGGQENEWDNLAVAFRFKDGWREKIMSSLGKGKQAHWRFEFGGLSGKIAVAHREPDDEARPFELHLPKDGLHLGEFVLSQDQLKDVLKLVDPDP